MSASMTKLVLTRPDDWHLHLRDAEVLTHTVPPSARRFARAIIMPNLKPPVTHTAQALAYRERILRALPAGFTFDPLMTLYLTADTTPQEIARAKASGAIHGVKYYPRGATTHAEYGVDDLEFSYPVLEAMEQHDLPLLVHGEVVAADVDVFDRERVFIERVLAPLCARFSALRIVLEHITTADAVAFVRAMPPRVGATITAHHLLFNRNALFAGGLRPHHYCLPVLKRERHRLALLEAATSGNPRFFLGTDSAPHSLEAKHTACGCAGIFSAPIALELYAQIFEHAGALHRLEAFASFAGADFYRLPRNRERITLIKDPWHVPDSYPLGNDRVVPLCAGDELTWRLAAAE